MASNASLAILLLLAAAGCGGGGEAGLAAAGDGESAGSGAATRTDSAAARPVIDSSLIPEPGEDLDRESFSYGGGSRDPFASLLEGRGIGPELSDLDVVGLIYVERDHRASAAILRDRLSGKQHTAREGERVGRARVSSIGATRVSFIIDDFGTQREVTLALRKREDVP